MTERLIRLREWLGQKRNDRGLLQKEVADECGIDKGHYANIEIGARNPSVKLAKKIAQCLDFDWTLFYE